MEKKAYQKPRLKQIGITEPSQKNELTFERFEKFVADLISKKVYSARFSFVPKGQVEVVFEVITNMPKVTGLDIESAFVNWVHRTDDYSFVSFVRYIYSKQPEADFTVLQRADYDVLIESLNSEKPQN